MSVAWLVWGCGALLYLIGFYQRVAPAVIFKDLSADFGLTGAALGNLTAAYFYSYTAMQIPTGILADRLGPRRILTTGCVLAALGTLVFALAPSLGAALIGRLIIGASVGVAFVAMLIIASRWMPPQHYAKVSATAMSMGIIGAVSAGVPLRMAVDVAGWRNIMLATAAITFALAIVTWLIVRDEPSQRGYRAYGHAHTSHAEAQGVLRMILASLAVRNVWLIVLIAIGIAGPLLAFAGLWGVPYLVQRYDFSAERASLFTSSMLVAWAAGSMAFGTVSDTLRERRLPLMVGNVIALMGWLFLVYMPPHSSMLLFGLVVMIGFASGAFILSFAMTKESVPPQLAGTASGICNMGPLTGGMLLQPGIGFVLDRFWTGEILGSARLYDASAWRNGLTLIVVVAACGAALTSLTREPRR